MTTATLIAAPHPSWCQPWLCTDIGPDRQHRDITLMQRTHDNVTVTVGLTRLDNPALDDTDRTHVALTLDDPAGTTVQLRPSEARRIADQLYADAARAENADHERAA